MIIEAHGLRKTFTAKRGRGKTQEVEAVRGIDLDVDEGEIFGLPRPERRRQDDHDPHARHVDHAHLRHRTGGRARPGERARRRSGAASATSARPAGVDETTPRAARACSWPRGSPGSPDSQALVRADELLEAFEPDGDREPARPNTLSGGQKRRFAHRARAGAPAAADLPRRAHHRPGPAEPRPTCGTRSRGPSRPGHQRAADHPLPGRGRRVVRPAGHRRPRPDRRRGHPRGAQEARWRATSSRSGSTSRPPPRSCCPRSRTSRRPRREGDALRAYLDDGEHNLPALLRALEAGGLAIRSIRSTGPRSTTSSCGNRPLPPRRRLTPGRRPR